MATPGTRVGRYKLERLVAHGGMAEVWEAHDRVLQRPVAVKVIFEQIAADPEFRERFAREARLVARLQHEHIVGIYDFDDEGCSWLVMPLLTRGSLVERLRQHVSDHQALSWLKDLASALDYAHGLGVVHRDMKPANVLFSDADRPLVSDFGLAKCVDETRHTRTGAVLGTPGYMSPEQLRGSYCPASDQYALAVIAYRMFVGRIPFKGDSVLEVAVKTLQEMPPPASTFNPRLPPGVDAILTRALSKDPSARYSKCSDMVNALTAAFDNGYTGRLDSTWDSDGEETQSDPLPTALPEANEATYHLGVRNVGASEPSPPSLLASQAESGVGFRQFAAVAVVALGLGLTTYVYFGRPPNPASGEPAPKAALRVRAQAPPTEPLTSKATPTARYNATTTLKDGPAAQPLVRGTPQVSNDTAHRDQPPDFRPPSSGAALPDDAEWRRPPSARSWPVLHVVSRPIAARARVSGDRYRITVDFDQPIPDGRVWLHPKSIKVPTRDDADLVDPVSYRSFFLDCQATSSHGLSCSASQSFTHFNSAQGNTLGPGDRLQIDFEHGAIEAPF